MPFDPRTWAGSLINQMPYKVGDCPSERLYGSHLSSRQEIPKAVMVTNTQQQRTYTSHSSRWLSPLSAHCTFMLWLGWQVQEKIYLILRRGSRMKRYVKSFFAVRSLMQVDSQMPGGQLERHAANRVLCVCKKNVNKQCLNGFSPVVDNFPWCMRAHLVNVSHSKESTVHKFSTLNCVEWSLISSIEGAQTFLIDSKCFTTTTERTQAQNKCNICVNQQNLPLHTPVL